MNVRKSQGRHDEAAENLSALLQMTRRWDTHLTSDYGAVQPMPLEVTP